MNHITITIQIESPSNRTIKSILGVIEGITTDGKAVEIPHSEPQEVLDARRLDDWLMDRLRWDSDVLITKQYCQRCSPIRDGKRLAAALNQLEAIGRIQQIKKGKSILIEINPETNDVAI